MVGRGDEKLDPASVNFPLAITARDLVPAYRLLGIWVACYLLFFSAAATKLPNYLLPIALPLALLGGRFLDRWRLNELHLPSGVMPLCLVSMALLCGLAGAGLMMVASKIPFDPFPGPYIGELRYWCLMSLIPAAAAALGWWALRRGHRNSVILSLLCGSIFFLSPMAAWMLPAFDGVKAPGPLVAQSQVLKRDQDIRIGGYQMEHLPSINFYSQREVMHQATGEDAIAFLQYPIPVYLFMPAPLWEDLKPKAPSGCHVLACHPDLYRGRDVVVIANRAD